MAVSVVEYTDPCCSWAWGTEPKFRKFRRQFADRMSWRTCMGGLVGDSSAVYEGMPVSEAASKLSHYWSKVTAVTTAPYPVRLQWPPITSNVMGQAVCAARLQSVDAADALLRRLREGVFVLGVPGDTWERVLDLAASVSGLDVERFAADLRSPEAEGAYADDWHETRRPNAFVRELTGDRLGLGEAKPDGEHLRYAFATLVITGPDGEATVPGWRDEHEYLEAFESAEHGITDDPLPLWEDARSALDHHGTLTPAEMSALAPTAGAVAAQPPSGANVFDWGAGPMWVSDRVRREWTDAGWWIDQPG